MSTRLHGAPPKSPAYDIRRQRDRDDAREAEVAAEVTSLRSLAARAEADRLVGGYTIAIGRMGAVQAVHDKCGESRLLGWSSPAADGLAWMLAHRCKESGDTTDRKVA